MQICDNYFTREELRIMRAALTMCHKNKKIEELIGKVNALYEITPENKKKGPGMTREEKVSHERLKIATKGRRGINHFANVAINKINNAKTAEYATFRARFACDVLMGVGYCTKNCEDCKIHQAEFDIYERLSKKRELMELYKKDQEIFAPSQDWFDEDSN